MNFFIALLMSLFFYNSLWAGESTTLKSPNVSANALFLYQSSNFHKDDVNVTNPDQTPNGLALQETEIAFYSDVDPYSNLNLLFSIHREFESGTGEEKWVLEPEEAFVESSNFVPATVLRAGKFKAFMGKHNTLHSHAFPFVKSPLANADLLTEEGLNDVGVSAATMLPASWFSEVTLQYLRGKGENSEFNSPSPGAGVGLVHFKNLFDLNDDLTMEVGISAAQGANSFRKNTNLTGADLTFRWRPASGGKYHSWQWATEYLSRVQDQASVPSEKGRGAVSWIQFQFAERWAALYRFDNLKVEDTFDSTNLPNDTWERHSIALAFMPSEFSSLKLEYNQRHGGPTNSDGESTEKALFIQANFTIGAHPSHSY